MAISKEKWLQMQTASVQFLENATFGIKANFIIAEVSGEEQFYPKFAFLIIAVGYVYEDGSILGRSVGEELTAAEEKNILDPVKKAHFNIPDGMKGKISLMLSGTRLCTIDLGERSES